MHGKVMGFGCRLNFQLFWHKRTPQSNFLLQQIDFFICESPCGHHEAMNSCKRVEQPGVFLLVLPASISKVSFILFPFYYCCFSLKQNITS
jgi:hypothetical protein